MSCPLASSQHIQRLVAAGVMIPVTGVPVTPSTRSIRRWVVGAAHQVKQGTHLKRTLRGKESLLTVLYRIAYPTCTADQMITFMFKCTRPARSTNARTMSRTAHG